MNPLPYQDFRYLWPPRPETKVAAFGLQEFDRSGKYVAQRKKNGSRTCIYVCGDRVEFRGRHGDDDIPQQWSPKPQHLQFLRTLWRSASSKGWLVLDCELLHSKVSGGPRDHFYIFDVLVHNGQQLTGQSFTDRQRLLRQITGTDDMRDKPMDADGHLIDPNFSVARCYDSDFLAIFNDCRLKPEDEGVVLKRREARLQPMNRDGNNSSWQIKCRHPKKNMSF